MFLMDLLLKNQIVHKDCNVACHGRRSYIVSRALLLFLMICFSCALSAQNNVPVATVMFYNLENLYDTRDDTLKNDEEFQPKGGRYWSGYRFYRKLTALSKVILNTGNWEPPAVIGFCEVENREVLEQLVRHPLLRNWDYAIIHKDSPDKRGIDVAAIYRPGLFHPLFYDYFSPVPEGEAIPKTREILHLCGILADRHSGGKNDTLNFTDPLLNAPHLSGLPGTVSGDTLHLFFNHWPSRYGGLMETRPLRQKAARRLKAEIVRTGRSSPHPLIICSGDFNDQPHDESLQSCLGASRKPASHPDSLVNLSFAWQKEGKGTLKYQSQWNIFDQFIVSEALLDTSRPLFIIPGDARILDAPFLMEEDEKYTGTRLKRTYLGFRYQGGFSDHLPVLLTLRRPINR